MIEQYQIRLHSENGEQIPAFWAYRLYAWLLQQAESRWGDLLHQQAETPVSQYLFFDRNEKKNIWVVNLLCEDMVRVFGPILSGMREIELNQEMLTVESAVSRRIETAEELILTSRKVVPDWECVRLSFCSPASFKQNGRYSIFPTVELLLQSLQNKWNRMCPDYPLADADAMQVLQQGLHIVDYSLHSARYPLKGTRIPGFTGYVILESRLAVPMREICQLLLGAAQYTGIGMKTALGMGGVHVEWLQPKRNPYNFVQK